MSTDNKRGRPTSRSRSVVSEAVTAVRECLGQTQQEFASTLGKAITTIARYETNRPPAGSMLAVLASHARQIGREEIAEVFEAALKGEQSLSEFDNPLYKAGLLALFYNRGPKWISAELRSLISDARKGTELAYPDARTLDRSFSSASQLRYLESLSTNLKELDAASKQNDNRLRQALKRGAKK